MKSSQAPSSILMVRPKSFGFNTQTASTNAFQDIPEQHCKEVRTLALKEFDMMVDVLHANDIDVLVVDDTLESQKPDAIFPNNWISFQPDGSIVLYPMMAANRRLERTIPVIDAVKQKFVLQKIVDLTHWENENKFLEGTGSVVFDYANRIAYAARSPRTDEHVLNELCERLHFKSIVFNAVDENSQAIYHTNVLMCIGTHFAIICLDAIKDDADQEILLDSLSNTNHKVIAISNEQMKLFAGNMMEVLTKSGEPVVLISEKAFYALLPGQLDALSRFAEPLPLAIPTIEQYGGGSVRCMVAGIFSPRI